MTPPAAPAPLDVNAATAATGTRPWWQRGRLWLVLAAVVLLAALAVAALAGSTGRPLDPASARHDGSKALAVLLHRYGSTVHAGDSAVAAGDRAGGSAVVVTAPDDYSDAQLRRLRDAAAELVLISPGTRAAAAVAPGVEPNQDGDPDTLPGCTYPGAQAAGTLHLPGDAVRYRGGTTSCYGGLLVTTSKVAILGSADLLRNDHLAGDGVAALDVNVIGGGRSGRPVQWLLAGSDAGGSGPASIWALFPAGAHRAFGWLIVLGAVLVLWRARRFGRVVTEPLPVVVRSAEIVEGHGRLYQRAGARDRAAAALRTATLQRLVARLALPPDADAAQVAAAVAAAAPQWQRSAAQTHQLLADGPVADDARLLHLAQDLDQLSAAVRAAAGEGIPAT